MCVTLYGTEQAKHHQHAPLKSFLALLAILSRAHGRPAPAPPPRI